MTSARNYRARIYPSYTSIYTPEAANYSNRTLEQNAKILIARIHDWLPADRSAACLDVACGAGALLYALDQAGFTDLQGVDGSAEQVRVAQKIFSKVVQRDAIEFLNENKERFDLITAFDIIEHFDKDEVFLFLDGLYGALRPGGRVIFQTPNADSPWSGTLRYGDFTHELIFSPGCLAKVMSVVGFHQFEARECAPIAHGVKSLIRQGLWKCIRAGISGWSLIETGGRGSGIFTRVFIAKGQKKR